MYIYIKRENIYIYVYIYIYREREREKGERNTFEARGKSRAHPGSPPPDQSPPS